MRLEDCTKSELIYFLKRRCFSQIQGLEFDILMYRSQKASEMSNVESAKGCDALGKYVELLEPYKGKRLIDIPVSVLKQADNAYKQSKLHFKKSEHYSGQYESIHKQIDKLQEQEVQP